MDAQPAGTEAYRPALAALAAILDVKTDEVETGHAASSRDGLVVQAGHRTFVLEVLTAGSAGPVGAHARRIAESAKKHGRRAIPVVAAPFMGPAARRASEAEGVSWFDLSGNAHIVAPGLRIIVDGRPNKFIRRGRPASIFAPKSARVVRWLLMDPERSFTQREIARGTEMSEGFVSRIVARLEVESYVVRAGPSGEEGAGRSEGPTDRDVSGRRRHRNVPLRVRDAAVLLDAWREEYQFDKHTIIQGHVAARSGDALARFVSDTLAAEGVGYAATGLAAAWQMTHFASFRIATFFVADEPSDDLKRKLGFREDPRGANLWLVVPNDAASFRGHKTGSVGAV